jgi:PhzF family phenazine biosynthesis protein
MSLRIFQVDAFTEKTFAGNPAGVCLLDHPMDDSWMQNVAAEMNLSETAFLLKQNDGWSLRWFTPKVEVDLCGHATLATAHVLAEIGFLKNGGEVGFHTNSGLLTARSSTDGIELNFPAKPEQPSSAPAGLIEALQGDLPKVSDSSVVDLREVTFHVRYIGKNQFDFLIEVETEEMVRRLAPDFERLKQVRARGVIITARSSKPEFDIVSRFFAPAVGINEDPVTGSAHCCLGPYWMKKLGKSRLRAFQASARGGILEVEVDKDRVLLRGKAVIVFERKLFV